MNPEIVELDGKTYEKYVLDKTTIVFREIHAPKRGRPKKVSDGDASEQSESNPG